jgi:hypothetical protein
MKKASYKSAIKSAKKTIGKLQKNLDFRGLNTKKNYSSFWMDSSWDNQTKFGGLSSVSQGYTPSNDIVKMIKLSNYRRAIANFVKIVTKQDIPVTWAGSTSFTDGKMICLSTDIKDNNFDVTVGLALHEGSHIILSDFDLLSKVQEGKCELVNDFWVTKQTALYPSNVLASAYKDLIKSILNWIEDRRIDHYIFSTSPGYKAYYHKMYDYYWQDKAVTDGLIAKAFVDPTQEDCWMFQIINMLNPNFDPKAMPGLEQVVSLIDVKNINRLQTTKQALEVTLSVVSIIVDHLQTNFDSGSDKINTSGGENDGAGGDSEPQGDGDNKSDTPEELKKAIQEALKKQKKFLDGKTNKKQASQRLTKQLSKIAEQDVEAQTVAGEDGIGRTTCLMFDLTSNKLENAYDVVTQIKSLSKEKDTLPSSHPKYKELRDQIDTLKEVLNNIALPDGVSSSYRGYDDEYDKAFKLGLESGGLLGKKLQLHNESRERVDNRLTTGKIDAKRLAHAGYGIENVFRQIHIDKYKKANLHISLDMSGSMGGRKWLSTITMTTAIAKAAAYTQGIDVQVSFRVTEGSPERPTVYLVYDSTKNSLNHLRIAFGLTGPCSMTPEGLCFEGMLKKGWFKASSNEMDSYFLNISDGAPGMSGYGGSAALCHTARIVNRMKAELSIQVLSFFIENTGSRWDDDKEQTTEEKLQQYQSLVQTFNGSAQGRDFKQMYGRDASVVDPGSALMIARELNKKFMTLAA